MPELRQDPATKQWVILATERARRPHDFSKPAAQVSLPEFKEDCPFCPGNESLTPPETMAYRKGGAANGPGWWVRAFPGSALDGGSLSRKKRIIFHTPDGRQAGGEIISPTGKRPGSCGDPRFKLIIIFKNHGSKAGTSLEHPHSQLVAMPIVPLTIRYRFEKAAGHFDDEGTCVYCDLLREGLNLRTRQVLDTDRFAAFHPFASRAPFETWIIPKVHNASFGSISMDEAKEFASVLKKILGKLYRGLNNPDYNYIIHTAPIKDEQEEYFHWHLQILPRLVTPAGFELGTGMFITPPSPGDRGFYPQLAGLKRGSAILE
jgi:UDPglucose--hexose-1-phosphate uridylyltransferase